MQKITTQFFLQVFLCNNTAGYQDYVASVVDERNMSMEHWWEGPDRKKLKYLGVGNPQEVPHVSPYVLGGQFRD